MTSDTQPKALIFVAMPFSERLRDVYLLGIKPACEAAGAYAERIDEQYFEHDILDRIYMQIDKADLVVADLTELNPNVFYEVGYAHALGKRVIFLTAGEDELPFDLTHYPHIVYGNRIADMKEELRARIEAALKQPEVGPTEPTSDLRIFYKGQELVDNPLFVYHGVADRMADNPLRFDIQHSGLRKLETVRFQAGVSAKRSIISLSCEGNPEHKVELGGGEYVCLSGNTFELFPGGWQSLRFRFQGKQGFSEGQILQFSFRVSSTFGAKASRFRLKMSDVEQLSI